MEVPRADERVARDTALCDLGSRLSLHDEDSAVLADAEKKAQSVHDSAVKALSAATERRNAARTTEAETSAKLCCVLEKITSDFNRSQHVAIAVSARVDDSKQIHREATKAHNCVVAAFTVVQQEHNSQRKLLRLSRRSRA